MGPFLHLSHVFWACVPPVPPHSLSDLTSFLLHSCFHFEVRWKHHTWMWKPQALSWKFTWMKAWVSSSNQYTSPLLAISPPHLPNSPPPFLAFSSSPHLLAISPHPKSLVSHWLLLPLSCLVPWMFDTCWRSKRGLLVSHGYKRNPSLPHLTSFFTVLLCYRILPIPPSLSHYFHIASLVLAFEELVAALMLQPLPI